MGGISAEGLSTSRDGQWVAYVKYPQGTLWRSRVDGNNRLQLTLPPLRVSVPHWSPDDKRILFMGTTPDEGMKLYIVPADGGAPEKVIKGQESEYSPTWSPEGNGLIFGGFPLGAKKPLAIHMFNLKTRHVSVLEGSEGMWYPICSPDGRYLAATDLAKNAMLFDFKSRQWAPIPIHDFNYWTWSRNSRFIYFDVFQGARRYPAVFRFRIGQSAVERVTNLRGVRRTSGVFGQWLGLAPDDSPLLFRNLSSQQVYALDMQFP
jgi:Tol biopolymer transport system component